MNVVKFKNEISIMSLGCNDTVLTPALQLGILFKGGFIYGDNKFEY